MSTYFEEQIAIFPQRPGVWNHTPTSEHKDRMANEGPEATPVGGYPLTDHGGSTIPKPKLVLVTLGTWWGDTLTLGKFALDIMTAGFLNPLTAYGSGPGTYLGLFNGPAISGTVSDAQIQHALETVIQTPPAGFPAPDNNTLYALLIPAGVTVDQGGSASCAAFCGYHDSFQLPSGQHVFYTVQTDTHCSGCNEGNAFGAFTAVLSHEIAEACTDAVPGQGWYNDATGMENADEWAWTFFPYGEWTIQGYQVNGVGNSQSLIHYSPLPPPQPQKFTVEIASTSPVVGTAQTFSARVSPLPSATTTYAWSFGDGGISTVNTPSHIYLAVGNYPVTLTVIDGAISGTGTSTAVVSAQPSPPPSTGTTPFWNWLAQVGAWGIRQPESARTAEVPTIVAQIHRYYPSILADTLDFIEALSTVPQPE